MAKGLWLRMQPLWRLGPIRRQFGFGHGQAIDRYYIEQFLSTYASDVRGHVLEVAENKYTKRIGGERVTRSDVLHVDPANPRATIIADLQREDDIPASTFDCIILTQTLQCIYDVRAVVATLYRSLKPRGVLLATLAGISQVSRVDMDQWGEYWRFTSCSTQRLFSERFPADMVTVKAYGNVLTCVAMLQGLVVDELRREELDYHDPDYEMLITARAVKPPAETETPSAAR
jgi:SAM-dependent methyltransferase